MLLWRIAQGRLGNIKAVLGSVGRQATGCRRRKASAVAEGPWPALAEPSASPSLAGRSNRITLSPFRDPRGALLCSGTYAAARDGVTLVRRLGRANEGDST
jgi:hypothetical protein